MKTLKARFGFLFLILILLNLVGYFIIFHAISGQKKDSRIVNLAGRQRMLTQKMSKEAFSLTQGKGEKEKLVKTIALFDKTLRGLVSGDAELGLPEAEDQVFIGQLQKVANLWVPFYKNIEEVFKNANKINDATNFIMQNNVSLLTNMDQAVKLMEKSHVNARIINLAGKQRMLCQKLSKEILEGLLEQSNRSLTKSAKEFDATLNALINGDASLGIRAIEDENIQNQLSKVENLWDPFMANVRIIVKERPKIDKALQYVRSHNVELLGEMNQAVKISEKISSDKVHSSQLLQTIIVMVMCSLLILAWFFIVNPLINVLKNTSMELIESAEQVAGAAGQMANSSQLISEGASLQASTLDEVTSSLQQMDAMTKNNADASLEAEKLAQASQKTAQKGNSRMEALKEAMEDIKAGSDEMQNIITNIKEIASQTNLLALNAAVEAGRAGEHGRGFSVVANEVRNLARKSADFARTTSVLILETSGEIQKSFSIAKNSIEAFEEIVSKANSVNDLISEIAYASQEQAQGLHQVSLSVQEVDKVVQSNAASSEEGSSISVELSSQAQSLEMIIAHLAEIVGLETRIDLEENMDKSSRHLSPRISHAKKHPNKFRKPNTKNRGELSIKPNEIIPLDEDDFKDF